MRWWCCAAPAAAGDVPAGALGLVNTWRLRRALFFRIVRSTAGLVPPASLGVLAVSHFDVCPFRSAFRAVAPIVKAANPGGNDLDVMAEYGFDQGGRFIVARTAVDLGLSGDWDGCFDMQVDAFRGLQEFVAAWSECLAETHGMQPQVDAAVAALAVALDPAILAAAHDGYAAARASLAPGAAPFCGASAAAARAGLDGTAALAFVSGFLAALPKRALRLDPVSGAVVLV